MRIDRFMKLDKGNEFVLEFFEIIWKIMLDKWGGGMCYNEYVVSQFVRL